ncbi:MAG: hypothetical protein ACK4FL_03570 [Microgenomates group bacterium]
MKKIISAYEARTKLGEIMNLAYYQGVEFIVEKMGKPLVKIVKVEKEEEKPDKKDFIEKYAGVWDNEDGKTISFYAKKFRKSFKLTR